MAEKKDISGFLNANDTRKDGKKWVKEGSVYVRK